jgi:hypothetical protein
MDTPPVQYMTAHDEHDLAYVLGEATQAPAAVCVKGNRFA